MSHIIYIIWHVCIPVWTLQNFNIGNQYHDFTANINAQLTLRLFLPMQNSYHIRSMAGIDETTSEVWDNEDPALLSSQYSHSYSTWPGENHCHVLSTGQSNGCYTCMYVNLAACVHVHIWMCMYMLGPDAVCITHAPTLKGGRPGMFDSW